MIEIHRGVVVTGIGMVTPIGRGVSEFWRNCLDGKSGISPIDDIGFPSQEKLVGGLIKNYTISDYYPNEALENLGSGSQFLYDCLVQSLQQAQLPPKAIETIYVGTTMGESANVRTIDLHYKGNTVSDKLKTQNKQENLIKGVTNALDISNVKSNFVCNACSGGNYALIAGFEDIRNGIVDITAVGGIDPFSTITLLGFKRLGALSKDCCRPFSADRNGMLVSEGGCMFILEEKEHALERNATILAEISGQGMSSDAYHINAPHPEGRGLKQAIHRSLVSAKIKANDVDYISLHGTGTPKNDYVESKVVNEIFGNQTPCSSIKSMIGHTMGAASAIESAVCCLSTIFNTIPPTINMKTKDPQCEINCVSNFSIKNTVRYALNLSAGFGGTNAAIIFKKWS